MAQSDKRFMTWITYLLIVAGLAFLIWAVVSAARAWSEVAPARHWRTVEGRVIGTGTEAVTVKARYGTDIAYTPVVRYSYRHGDRTLTGERVYLGEPRIWPSEHALAPVLAAYPPGAPVTVHYDPADPERAALRIEGNFTDSFVAVAGGLLFSFMGWGLYVIGRRLRRRTG